MERDVPSHPVRVAIDLETTGLNAESDAIIEIGAVRFAGDRTLGTFETLVAANTPLPYRIQRLTGIKPGELRRAPPLAPLLPRLRAFVADAPLVGHNVAFDAAFLRRVGILAHNPLIDTYELASMLLPQLSSYTLASVGAALGLSSDERHRALADADLARRIFVALHERLQQLDTGALEALQALPAARDWTLGYLVRSELRARREAAGGTFAGALTANLGDQLARQLGVDPAVLTLAGAGSPRPAATTATAPTGSATAVATAYDERADARLDGATTQIGAALDAGGALVVEIEHDRAGLLACVTAALRWSAATGERISIAAPDGETARRLAREIVPAARARLNGAGDSLSVAELAEREAYLCLWRWFGMARADGGSPLSRDVTRGMTKLLTWSRETTTGLRADVALSGQEQQAWERVRAGHELLDSAAVCPYDKRGHCFLTVAQLAGQAAQVVVTTHAALAAQLAGQDDLLTVATRVLLLDAHLFEEQLRSAGSVVLDRTELLALLAQLAELRPEGRAGLLHIAAAHIEKHLEQHLGASGGRVSERAWFDAVARARRCVESFFAALQSLMAQGENGRSESRRSQGEQPDQRALRIDEGLRRSRASDEVVRAWESLARDLSGLAKLLREVASSARAADRKLAGSGSGLPLELLGFARRLETLIAAGNSFVGADEAENMVAWLRVPYPQTQDRGRPPEPRPSRNRAGQGKKHAAKQKPATSDAAVGTFVTADADAPPAADVVVELAAPATDSGTDAKAETGERPAVSPAPGASAEKAPTESETRVTEDGSGDEFPVAYAAPVHVGELFAALVASGRGVIVASPALAVAGDFEHVRGSLGLPEATRSLRLTADRSEQTLLCLPSDVPEPNAPHYQRTLEDALIALATALSGRLVAIFPSHAALRSSYNGIRRALEARDILVLAQGQDGSARQLWQQFASERRIVLLGAGVFWDGSLQRHPPACVVVTRLPFPALSDPLLAARAEGWDDPQSQFVVPQAALKLRQALSGLAWSHSARNAVVLFDRRAQTRGYGSTVLDTLPPCSQHQEPMAALAERIAEWVGPV